MGHNLNKYWTHGTSAPARTHNPTSGTVGKITALLSNVSVRTLILGIDEDGRIIQHDRNAPEILPLDPDSLVGAHLGDLVAGRSTAEPALTQLLEAVKAGREATAVLPISTREGRRVE